MSLRSRENDFRIKFIIIYTVGGGDVVRLRRRRDRRDTRRLRGEASSGTDQRPADDARMHSASALTAAWRERGPNPTATNDGDRPFRGHTLRILPIRPPHPTGRRRRVTARRRRRRRAPSRRDANPINLPGKKCKFPSILPRFFFTR